LLNCKTVKLQSATENCDCDFSSFLETPWILCATLW